jgi:hypothetical protein
VTSAVETASLKKILTMVEKVKMVGRKLKERKF